MNQSILTPEQIYQLDIFSLEEKIQELQNHKNKLYFQSILTLARLQLSERQKIQEWANKLVFDPLQYPTPQIKSHVISCVGTSRKSVGKKIDRQMQNNFLLSTLSNSKSYVIGKPALKATFQLRASNIGLQRNKKNQKRNSIKSNTKIPQSLSKKPNIFPKIDPIIHVASKPYKKQILKPEIMIKFQQNDVYDLSEIIYPQVTIDMSQIKPLPQVITRYSQNISQINNKSYEQPSIPQIIQIELTPISNQKINQSIMQEQQLIVQNSKTNQSNNQVKNCSIKQPLYEEHLQFKQQNIEQAIQVELIEQKIDQKKNYQIIEQIKEQKSRQEQKTQTKQQFINRGFKSKSHKFFRHSKFKQLYSTKQQQNAHEVQILNIYHQTNNNFPKKNNINLLTKNETNQYHLVIPSFTKLFPNSKNIYQTLINFQEGLKLHINKNADKHAKSDQYMALSSQTLTFKVVTEMQKVIKYGSYTNLNLDQYRQRSQMMLKRIKKQNKSTAPILLFRVVRTKQDVYDIISSGFHRTQNWYQLPHGFDLKNSWNLLWTWSKPQIDFSTLFYFQKVNHFLGNKEIARKDLLKKNIQKIKKLGTKAKIVFDIIPQTYLLPAQNLGFVKKFREYGKNNPQNIWIMKPIGLSRGRGIQVVNRLQDIIFSEPVVIQRYISDPLLLNGYKFDMRIYVLVSSINPLEAYIYQEGFARISTHQYSTQTTSLCDKFIHLTNYSIQKQNISQQANTFESKIGGSKISLKMLKAKIQQAGIQWEYISNQIQQIIIKSLVACMNQIPQNHNSFQLFGYDIMIDSKLKCWLLQVNSSPSLQKDFILDQIIKQQLVDDTIRLVNPLPFDRNKLLQVIQRRRKEMQGLKSHINIYINSNEQLNHDINDILYGGKLNIYGETNPTPYNYRRLAPGPKYQRIVNLIQHYKIDPIVKPF